MNQPSARRSPVGRRLLLYWHTLRHLRVSQFAWLVTRRLLPAPRFRAQANATLRPGFRCRPFLQPPVPAVHSDQIAFLNSAASFTAGAVDWAAAEHPKLWRYNLHYFDYLHWPVYDAGTKAQLIDDWIRSNPPPNGDAWEPYPTSLRIVNWIKYAVSDGVAAEGGFPAMPATWRDSLAGQLDWLERNIEHQLLANHLLKNAKALFFGGVFLDGRSADRWRDLGLQIMAIEADEQILPDGGHFERSPMYHCIVLEDLLDVLNLLESNAIDTSPDRVETIRQAAMRATAWLGGMTGGDGRIPLFNDAAYGIAPDPHGLDGYSSAILGTLPTGGTSDGAVNLPDSGYFGWRAGGDSILIDCGPVGPDYQPGHAHCDALSYELCLRGQRVIVDTGVHDYETGISRHYVRSTAAHNTVRVDGEEQTEIWGAFRVARRARPLRASFRIGAGDQWEFEGAHDGYRRLPAGMVHERRIVGAAGRWSVFDLITGDSSAPHRIESYIHFHPGLEVVRGADGIFFVKSGELAVCRIKAECPQRFFIEEGYYCPEFGRCEANVVLVFRDEMVLPARLSYTIERA